MGRPVNMGYIAGMPSNPYPKPKEVQALNTTCEVCDRVIKTKDWLAHKNSKKHRQAEEKVKENLQPAQAPMADDAGNVATDNGFSNYGGWGTVGDSFGDDATAGYHAQRGAIEGGAGGCYLCGEDGHMKRDCPKQGGQRGCFNCGETGHRKADCPNPPQGRPDRACFKCGQTGHSKADCPNEAQGGGGGGRLCHNCQQPGHNKSDCPNERVMKCRNCDAIGHMSKECDQPKDWSRVKCNNCQNMGHTVKRCPEPIKEQTGFGGFDNDTGAVSGDWAGTDTGGVSGDANGSWADAGDDAAATASWGDATGNDETTTSSW